MMTHSKFFYKLVVCGLFILLTKAGNSYAGFNHKGVKNKCGIRIESLQCENQTNPVGIDLNHPRLAWILNAVSEGRGQYQTACQIQVASSKELLQSGKPDLWDSGMIDSARNNHINYQGDILTATKRYYWRVKVWDTHHIPSVWSKPAFWEMGLMDASDWKGKWIGDTNAERKEEKNPYGDNPAPLFRREFATQKIIKRAVMYVSGIGYYEAYINGKKVGNKFLDPGWTDYSKRVLYSTYDVSSYLTVGNNCVGMLLGNGWYNPLPLKMWSRKDIRDALATGQPKFIMQLNIEYADGTKDQIVSDNSWKVTAGPIIRNSIYIGEKYDARKEIPGWNIAGLKTDDWKQAQDATPPGGKLQSQQQPAIIAGETLRPVLISKKAAGKYIVDFGRNFGGIIRLKAKGKSGTVIHVKYGELLYPDGTLNMMTSTAGQIKRKGVGGIGAPDTAYARDVFILAGKETEIFQPHFTFHGFRYIEINGYPGTLQKEDIQGLVLYSGVPDAGAFACSDTLINQIQKISLNTFRSNLFSVQSDCPQRERFGYGGDIVATCEAFMDNFNMAGFYEKTVNDFADAAQPDGGLTELAPFVGIASDGLGGKSGPVEWGSVLPVLLYKLYQYYGNIDQIKQYYPIVKNWVDFMQRNAKDGIINVTIGDHESLDQKIVGVSATAFYYYNTQLLLRFAKLLNKQDDLIRYSAVGDQIKNAFISHYLDTSTGNIDIHTAAAQAYALYFNLIPDQSVEAVLAVLLKDIDANKNHITSGIFGTRYLLEVLSQTGNNDLAYKIATQKTFPGWGYMIANGATTLWEHWAFSDNTYSHNHPMFGSISDWFYRSLAGIRPADDAVGFDKIIIQPQIADLTWAKASYQSVPGKISSDWKRNGKTFLLDINIPVNATAEVHIPGLVKNIREGGASISSGKGSIHFISEQKKESVFRVGSGHYRFTAVLPDNGH